MNKCPECQSMNAYIGFLVVECPNLTCKHYTEKQLSIVMESNNKNKTAYNMDSENPYDDYYDNIADLYKYSD